MENISQPPSEDQSQSFLDNNQLPTTQNKNLLSSKIVTGALVVVALILVGFGSYGLGMNKANKDKVVADPQPASSPIAPTIPEEKGVACTMDAMECPDGSYVGRTGPNCEFVCPESKTNNEKASDWNTYSSQELGISLQYPPTMRVVKEMKRIVPGGDIVETIKVGDMLTINPYYDRLETQFYKQNQDLIEIQSKHPPVTIGEDEFVLTKFHWEDGGGNQGTEQSSYFADIPGLISLDIHYQINKTFNDSGKLLSEEYAVSGDKISDFDERIAEVYSIISTISILK